MKEFAISTEALAVLSLCTQTGQVVQITSGQLARPLYQEVDKVLKAIGGKWDRKKAGHVFTEPASEVADMLEGCIQTGLATPLRPGSYFPTPPELGKRMVDLAQIEPGMTVLEPSAGDGQLAVVILQQIPTSCHVVCIEDDRKLFLNLSERLGSANGTRCIHTDFLKYDVPFDRVIMNPPFQKLQDVDHIMHAWNCLKPKGRIVSVASASVTFRLEKRALDFRTLVAGYGKITPLPQNTFKPSGTLVNTVLVEMQKP